MRHALHLTEYGLQAFCGIGPCAASRVPTPHLHVLWGTAPRIGWAMPPGGVLCLVRLAKVFCPGRFDSVHNQARRCIGCIAGSEDNY